MKFYSFTLEALRLVQKYFKLLLFIITNQTGISRGYLTLEQVKKVNEYILKELKRNGIRIENIYCCSHSKEDNCSCMKPYPYFVNLADKEYGLDLSNSYIIGDHPSDMQLARNTGMTGIYVMTGHGKKHINEINGNVIKRANLKKGHRVYFRLRDLQ